MPTIPVEPDYQGKVRDIYDLGDSLLMVASDRISAFDYILQDIIPQKGAVLTQLSSFWFDYMADLIPNHVLSLDAADLPQEFQPYAQQLQGRSMLVRKIQMFPIECVVRGYLAGSGLKEYQECGSVNGIQLPEGLVNSSKLPEPIFTPSSKGEVGSHDLPMTFQECVDLLGSEHASALRDLSLTIYSRAADYAAQRGIIIADTKFEFGILDGQIVLADEVLTPDSSRFWPADLYQEGSDQPSFDKQFVRDWLKANWDFQGEPPHLPQEVIEGTTQRYIQAFETLTDRAFQPSVY